MELTQTRLQEILEEAAERAIDRIQTASVYKVIKVNTDNTVDLEPVFLTFIPSDAGEYTIVSRRKQMISATSCDTGYLLRCRYLIRKHGQWIDEVAPAVGDVGIVLTFYEDMRRWSQTGEKALVASDSAMVTMSGSAVFIPYFRHDAEDFTGYPTDNSTRIIKSNRITTTISDPLDENGQSTGNESVTIAMTGITITVDSAGTITVNAPNATTNINCTTANITATGSTTIDSPATTITGTLEVGSTIQSGGNITSGGDVITSTGITLDTHTHQVTGAAALVPPPAPTPETLPPTP